MEERCKESKLIKSKLKLERKAIERKRRDMKSMGSVITFGGMVKEEERDKGG